MQKQSKKQWRQISGTWHYVEQYPNASKVWTLCGCYLGVGIFDTESETIPNQTIENLCQECLKRQERP